MKFFATPIIRELDQYTILHEPITSIDLMERAAMAIANEFKSRFSRFRPVIIFAGQGNNGGDGLALARLLLDDGYEVKTYLFNPASSDQSLSTDCQVNKDRLVSKYPNSFIEIRTEFAKPTLTSESIVVDALFGSGLSRPLVGGFAAVVKFINQSPGTVVSIDIPSGLMGEENDLNESSVVVKADLTLALQFPKFSFFFAENEPYIGEWKILDIQLHNEAIEQTESNLYYLEENDIISFHKKRKRFTHKGQCGHVALIAGQKGMAGAAILSAKGALRGGAGLVSVFSSETNLPILQTAVPEAIFRSDNANDNPEFSTYDAVAVGSGMGTGIDAQNVLRKFLESQKKPCVIDADALNIIAKQREMLKMIPRGSILTPHPKEFDRLFGDTKYSYQRVAKAQNAAKQFGFFIILKGANTLIATPDSNLYFNSTGNAGLATGGSGDVLTGILAALLAQGYSAEESSKLGVFLHGRAADIALHHQSVESLISSDLFETLGKAFKSIQ